MSLYDDDSVDGRNNRNDVARSGFNRLSEGRIDALTKEKYGYQAIANKITKSKTAVHNYLNPGKRHGVNSTFGRPPLLFERAKQALVNCAKGPGMTAKKVAAHTGVRESVRTVQRVLQHDPEMAWGKPKVRLSLTKRVIGLRLQLADDMLTKSEWFWRRTLFTDEKRISSDSPDNVSDYCRDKQLPPSIFSKRAGGGEGLMEGLEYVVENR